MISVIVPTVNRRDLLAAALVSLAAQTHQDFEVVVVNDGGVGVEDVVVSFRDRLAVRLVELPRRCGASHARNRGIELASGEYVAFLDDDDIFLPWHLAEADRALRRSKFDCVYLGAVVSEKRITALPSDCGGMPHKAYPFDDRFLLVANYIHTGSLIARNFKDSPVRFDESLSHCEDWSMWIALRNRLTYRFGFIETISSVYHQVSGVDGMVASGQAVTPSPFSIARQRIYAQWSTSDRQVRAYRDWLTTFDARCNDLVRRGGDVPLTVFDQAVRQLHADFTAARSPKPSLIQRLLNDVG